MQKTQKLIKKDFLLGELPEVGGFDELKTHLTALINELLDKDLNKLLLALYRIDIREEKIKNILAHAPADEMAPQIAELIIKRELQKVKTREQYKP